MLWLTSLGGVGSLYHSLHPISRIRHKVVVETLVVDCFDSRFAEAQFDYCNHRLRLGRFKRDWQLISIAGGAAAFAHYERQPAYFATLVENLRIKLLHFPVKHLIVIGHCGCNFAASAHKDDELPDPKFDWAREDSGRVALAFNNRRNAGTCSIGAAVRDFTGDARVIFTDIKKGTKDVPVFEDLTRTLA